MNQPMNDPFLRILMRRDFMDITDLVSVLPGVGPKRAENLQELGIATIEDLLTYYPFRYDDIKKRI